MAKDQDRQLTDAERAEYDKSLEEFKQHKREQHQKMLALQSLPFDMPWQSERAWNRGEFVHDQLRWF